MPGIGRAVHRVVEANEPFFGIPTTGVWMLRGHSPAMDVERLPGL